MNCNKPLIIYTHGSGRLGNQLFSYAHFVAFLSENPNRYDFINFGFIPYSRLLKSTSENLCCICPTEHNSFILLKYLAPILEAKSSSKLVSNLQEKLIDFLFVWLVRIEFILHKLVHIFMSPGQSCDSRLKPETVLTD